MAEPEKQSFQLEFFAYESVAFSAGTRAYRRVDPSLVCPICGRTQPRWEFQDVHSTAWVRVPDACPDCGWHAQHCAGCVGDALVFCRTAGRCRHRA